MRTSDMSRLPEQVQRNYQGQEHLPLVREVRSMTTLYKKHGKRYKPVQGTIDTLGWPPGAYIVTVEPNFTTTRRAVVPAWPELSAALQLVENELAKWIVAESNRATTPLTPEQKRLWDALKLKTISLPSASEVTDKLLAMVAEKAKGKT